MFDFGILAVESYANNAVWCICFKHNHFMTIWRWAVQMNDGFYQIVIDYNIPTKSSY